MSRGFTARHMWMVMIGFFGLIIAVNFTMAWFASNTFGGTVVENSYVASQRYNGWLAAARVQKQLGWSPTLAVDAGRHVTVAVAGGAPQGFTATGTARHPLGRAADVPLAFTIGDDNVLRSDAALPRGRWHVAVALHRGSDVMRLGATLQ
ncbi:FixH family protein [Polymorphobacter fuscus]|uniref:Nitrogen fixation protein FixH n=1 Tax=Sandarakinorhabdus fusca TaxID=1439888 RepID=A0A7C9GQ51_9SPHN|nr:FixH family protein [Polymorphobacter fuscus]KAB7648672.1 FixH family protein [Polymorphobacter fuscus]MQT16231.1 hypothetical protein [Polymorphobacter fuscus]NJC07484.1 nitrogen fixation protein FixH [Polymorphobacter fuscus]